jgi:hypothetical protein
MAENRTEKTSERQALRRQLRGAGWNLGGSTASQGRRRWAVWPAPHKGPAAGIAPYWVEGASKIDALRTAVRELCGSPPAEEPQPPDATNEERQPGAAGGAA